MCCISIISVPGKWLVVVVVQILEGKRLRTCIEPLTVNYCPVEPLHEDNNSGIVKDAASSHRGGSVGWGNSET